MARDEDDWADGKPVSRHSAGFGAFFSHNMMLLIGVGVFALIAVMAFVIRVDEEKESPAVGRAVAFGCTALTVGLLVWAIIRHAREMTGNVSLTCRYFGITRQAYYTWLRRYEQGGLEGLRDRSGRPRDTRSSTTSNVLSSTSRPASSGGRCPAPGAYGLRTGSTVPPTRSRERSSIGLYRAL